MATFPNKVNYATGDILTATNMNDVGGAINLLESAQFAAGKNKIINGDFGIWQRGTSFSGAVYNADRWTVLTDATVTTSQQTFTAGTAPVAGYEGQFFQRTAKSAGGSYAYQEQRIEDVRAFAGQTVTLSFWAKADAGITFAPQLGQYFGIGGSAGTNLAPTSITLTTSWARYSVTISVPSISGKTIGTGSYLYIRTVGVISAVAFTIDIWGVQLEAASTASNFQTATGTKQGEIAACQRYYYRTQTGIALNDVSVGGVSSSTTLDAMVVAPVQMRIAPTALEQSGTAGDYSVKEVNTNYACSAVPTFVGAGLSTMTVRFTVASGLTAGRAGFGRIGVSGYLGWSAEL